MESPRNAHRVLLMINLYSISYAKLVPCFITSRFNHFYPLGAALTDTDVLLRAPDVRMRIRGSLCQVCSARRYSDVVTQPVRCFSVRQQKVGNALS